MLGPVQQKIKEFSTFPEIETIRFFRKSHAIRIMRPNCHLFCSPIVFDAKLSYLLFHFGFNFLYTMTVMNHNLWYCIQCYSKNVSFQRLLCFVLSFSICFCYCLDFLLFCICFMFFLKNHVLYSISWILKCRLIFVLFLCVRLLLFLTLYHRDRSEMIMSFYCNFIYFEFKPIKNISKKFKLFTYTELIIILPQSFLNCRFAFVRLLELYLFHQLCKRYSSSNNHIFQISICPLNVVNLPPVDMADHSYPEFTTWEIICFIMGGTLLFCTITLSSYWYFQRRKGSGIRQFTQNEDSVCDPILNGNTIHDIIEMTTSGSGSGTEHSLQFVWSNRSFLILIVQ